MSPARISLWRDRLARFALGASATTASAATGVLRNKWLALHLETAGLGVLAQVLATQTWLGTMAGLGLALPVARRVGGATASEDPGALRRATWTALALAAGAGLALATLGILFAASLSRAVLGSPDHAGLVRVSMLGVAGLAMSSVLQGLFAGRSDLRAPLTLSLVGGLVALATALVLVPRTGLWGGAWAAAVLFPAGIAGFALIHRRSYGGAFLPRPEPALDGSLAKELLTTGAAALALPLLDTGTLLAIRSHYLRLHGASANGLLQAALALSQQVGALFYAYLANYAFGKVSGLKDARAVQAYTRRQWTPLLLLAALFFALAMVAATPLLHILYSSRFDGARPLMAWALLGEFFRVASYACAIGAMPLGGARLWFAIGLAQPTTLALGYALLTASGAGIVSLPLAYVAAGAASLGVAAFAMARRGVTPSPGGAGIVLGSGALLALLARWVTR
jgi:O-antigen/teichoic acid export membrane protein